MAWLTIAEAARLLRCSPRRIRDWIDTDPTFPVLQTAPHRWRIPESELAGWARQRRASLAQTVPEAARPANAPPADSGTPRTHDRRGVPERS